MSCHAGRTDCGPGCTTCHRGDADTPRKALAHQLLLTGPAAAHRRPDGGAVREGRTLVAGAGCRRCHTIASSGNQLATDLDAVIWTRSQQAVRDALEHPVDNMPRFRLTGRQQDTVMAYLLGSADPARRRDTYRVRYEDEPGDRASPFDDLCGGCHRMLGRAGAFGRGTDGPNLSGLLTPSYPRRDVDWSVSTLTAWLANPRALRPTAAMPPVGVTDAEREQLLNQLAADDLVRH